MGDIGIFTFVGGYFGAGESLALTALEGTGGYVAGGGSVDDLNAEGREFYQEWENARRMSSYTDRLMQIAGRICIAGGIIANGCAGMLMGASVGGSVHPYFRNEGNWGRIIWISGLAGLGLNVLGGVLIARGGRSIRLIMRQPETIRRINEARDARLSRGRALGDATQQIQGEITQLHVRLED